MENPDFIKYSEPGMLYGSTKTYNHSIGLTSCFRQWRAESHCKYLHGYSLRVHFDFQTTELDHRNWAVDFGSLKSLKGWLEDTFDHRTLVAEDDPEVETFKNLHLNRIIQMRVVPSTGCEAFARLIYEYAEQWLKDNGYNHITLNRVTVNEHESNGAYYGKV